MPIAGTVAAVHLTSSVSLSAIVRPHASTIAALQYFVLRHGYSGERSHASRHQLRLVPAGDQEDHSRERAHPGESQRASRIYRQIEFKTSDSR